MDTPDGKNIGLLKLMAEASRKLEFRWRNADQVILFGAMTCGIVMLFLYVAGLIAFIMTSPVMAAAWDMFQTPYPEKDIAFMMLDKTFGIPGLYGSEVSTNAAVYGPFPNAFHLAMWELFRFFSMGLFIIAMFIFLYHVVTIVLEITQTGHTLAALSDGEQGGHNFGWLPLRYLIALGLLLPFGNGMNSAQWITMYVAKFGSGLATNAWYAFNNKTGGNPIGDTQKRMVAVPTPPDTTTLIKNMMLITSCIDTHLSVTYNGWLPDDGSQGAYDISPFIVTSSGSQAFLGEPGSMIANNDSYNAAPGTIVSLDANDAFIKVLAFTGGQDIHVVFGYVDESNPDRFKDYPGGVLPVCGEVIIPVTGFNGESIFAAEGYFFAVLHQTFFIMRNGVQQPPALYDSELATTREFLRTSSLIRELLNEHESGKDCMFDSDGNKIQQHPNNPAESPNLGPCTDAVPSDYWYQLILNYYSWAYEIPTYAAYDFLAGTQEGAAYDGGNIKYSIGDTSYNSLGLPVPMLMDQEIIERGWGGAGLWYNKISERNGALYSAINSTPIVRKFPMVIENMKSEREKNDSEIQPKFCEQFNPRRSGVSESNTGNQQAQFAAEEARSLHTLCLQLNENENIVFNYVSNTTNYTNPVLKSIAALFSQIKLFDLRDNDEVTPMAQLSAIGRLLLDKAIFNLMTATGASFAGGLIHASGGGGSAANSFGQAMGLVADSAISFAVIGLSIGVLLHYVLPFMPFIYFFFAIGTWVKSVFEALVGVPLWALAHLSAKGEGLPGAKAASGYFLLLEIMIRPVIIVFSLIASFAIFSAAVSVLNSIFALVTTNVLGAATNITNGSMTDADLMDTTRGIADQFFYTILYIIIVYMIGSSAFKLINLIPDGILRWSGMGVQSFGRADRTEDLVSMLPTQVPIITQQMTGQMGGLIKEALYKPAAQWGMKKEKEAAEAKALEDAKIKAEQEQKARGGGDGAGN